MTTFNVGDRVVLDGEAWDQIPAKGQVVTVERMVWPDFVTVGVVGAFTLGGEEWIIWGEDGHPFHVSLVTDEEPSQVGTRGLGHLDGALGLPLASSDDEYMLGYLHGCERKEQQS